MRNPEFVVSDRFISESGAEREENLRVRLTEYLRLKFEADTKESPPPAERP